MTPYIQKLAYQISPFHVENFNWNALNAQNQPQQYGNAGGGGNGFMNGLGALMLPALMGGMNGAGATASAPDNRSFSEHFEDKTKAVKNVAKATPGAIADAGSWVGRNLSPSGIFDAAKNAPGEFADASVNLWNAKAQDRPAAWGNLALSSIVPGFAAGGAAWGALNSKGWLGRTGGALRGAWKGTGMPTAAAGSGSLSGLWQGLKTFGTKTPGATTLGNVGRVGLAAAGKTVGGLGLGMNLYDEAAGNTDYGDMESFSDIGEWAKGGLRALGNNLAAAGSGAQLAGPAGAVWGAGAHLATGLGRGAWDIYKAKRDGAEAEAGAQKWQDRTQIQQRLKAQMGDENWKRHVALQRAAGKQSWDAPAYAPEALTAAPVTTPAPTPAPARTLGKDMGQAPAKPAGPTPSPAIETDNVPADRLKPAPGTVGATSAPSANAPGVK